MQPVKTFQILQTRVYLFTPRVHRIAQWKMRGKFWLLSVLSSNFKLFLVLPNASWWVLKHKVRNQSETWTSFIISWLIQNPSIVNVLQEAPIIKKEEIQLSLSETMGVTRRCLKTGEEWLGKTYQESHLMVFVLFRRCLSSLKKTEYNIPVFNR